MNTIAAASPGNERFVHLVGDLQSDLKNLIKKEIELAKTEMGEKVRVAARNAAYLAAGGVAGLMAAFLMFLGLGAVIALALAGTGLSAGMAYFISYAGLAVILGVAALLLVRKALRAFQNFSITPEKALETVRGPEGLAETPSRKIEVEHSKPNSDELATEVEITRSRLDEEISELRSRLTPGYLARSTAAGVRHHPLRALLLTAGTGVGGYLLWKHNHHLPAQPVKVPRWSMNYWISRLKGAKA